MMTVKPADAVDDVDFGPNCFADTIFVFDDAIPVDEIARPFMIAEAVALATKEMQRMKKSITSGWVQ